MSISHAMNKQDIMYVTQSVTIHVLHMYIPAIMYKHFIIQPTCTLQSGTSAVLLACQCGHRELLEILIDRYHCSATDKDKACGCMACIQYSPLVSI